MPPVFYRTRRTTCLWHFDPADLPDEDTTVLAWLHGEDESEPLKLYRSESTWCDAATGTELGAGCVLCWCDLPAPNGR